MTLPIKFFFLLFIPFSFFYFFRSFLRKWKAVQKGRGNLNVDRIPQRLFYTLFIVFSQLVAVKNKPFIGILHGFIFWGFFIFLISTLDMTIRIFVNWSLLDALKFKTFYTVIADWFSFLVILGVICFAIRRFFLKPKALIPLDPETSPVLVNPKSRKEGNKKSFYVLSLIFLLMVSYALYEGIEIHRENSHNPLLFMGNLFYSFLPLNSPKILDFLYYLSWYSHVFFVFLFLIVIPESKHLHILTGFINVFLKREKPYSYINPVDFEKEEFFGVQELFDISKKNLFDSYACIECGRCQEQCPAFITLTPLSPKWLIVNLRENINHYIRHGESFPVTEYVLSPEALWSCTTCGVCMEVCPMEIEHIPLIIDIRRGEVMAKGSFPKELNPLIRGLENQGNPWGIWQGERKNWYEGLDVKTMRENPKPDYLLFVGCAASFDDRAKKIARALVNILNKFKINFSILGEEETCNGDPARRIGNEFLFQTMAQQLIDKLNSYGIKRIITICPHCYNIFKNEYPDFGGSYEVIHHTQFLRDLLRKEGINVKKYGKRVTFHDACYLGRHNEEYDAPRELINKFISEYFREMKRSKNLGLCCGAGGAKMWMEEYGKTRVNHERIKEALSTGAELVLTSCPFCLRMLADAIGELNLNEKLEVKDIAEVIWVSLEKEPNPL